MEIKIDKTIERLISNKLYEEIFIYIEEKCKNFNKIEKSTYIKEFFNYVLIDKLDEISYGGTYLFSKALSKVLSTPFYEDIKERLEVFVSDEHITLMYAALLKEGDIDNAELYAKYVDKEIKDFKFTLNKVIETKNIAVLDVMCKNLKNIHFQNDELLTLVAPMGPEALDLLINKYGFNINKESSNKFSNKLSLVSESIKRMNYDLFDYLINNHWSKIKWTDYHVNLLGNFASRPLSEFYSRLFLKEIDKEMYSTLVKNLFGSLDSLRDIDEKLLGLIMKNKFFDPLVINYGQRHLLYGVLSNLSTNDQTHLKINLKILKAYLSTVDENQYVITATYKHVLGAAVMVAKENQNENTYEALKLICHKFPSYINKPNPDGTLPIIGVDKNSNIYSLLIECGAVPPIPEKGYWASIIENMSGKNKSKDNHENNEDYATTVAVSKDMFKTIKNDFKKSYNDIKDVVKKDEIDGFLKMKIENMFLKANKLLLLMEEHDLKNDYDSLNFLSENFAVYLKKSLEKYIEVNKLYTTISITNELEGKIEKAKKECIEQVSLIEEQILLIADTLFKDVENKVVTDQKIHKNFLKETLARN